MNKYRRMLMDRIDSFTTKHPLIGPIFWILGLQYFVTQLVVAAAWPTAYSWRDNLISDLGVVASCGIFDERYVCSPLGWLMNISFGVFGITIAVGAALIYTEFKRTNLTRLGFGLVFLSGVGGFMVGVFPLDTAPLPHNIGATAGLLIGNVGLVALAISLRGIRTAFRLYTLLTGGICITGFILFVAGQDFGIGNGNIERVASYPFALWMAILGMYMTFVRFKRKTI